MIFYAALGACSQASHIALIEAHIPYKLVKVGGDKKTDDGRDFNTINPKGCTPALELGEGTILTESLAILIYFAETSGKLLAKEGHERWKTLELLEFMITELHGAFRVFFHPEFSEADKEKSGDTLGRHSRLLNDQLGRKTFLLGDHLTIADTYLFVMLSWAAMIDISIPEQLAACTARMKKLASVTHALVTEGLV